MNVLVLNPGGNSLKAEVISCSPTQTYAFEGKKIVSVILEGIGKEPCLSVMEGKKISTLSRCKPGITGKPPQAYSPG